MKRGTIADYIVVALSVLSDFNSPFGFWAFASESFRRKSGMVSYHRMAGREGSLVWRLGIYSASHIDRMLSAYVATYARLLKTSMLDVVNQDYVLTAESKGLSKGKIISKHILRNSFIPVMTQLPMSVAMCITGSFFIESIFSIPGIGQYYVTAVK